MDFLSISVALSSGGEGCKFISGSHVYTRDDLFTLNLSKSLGKTYNGVWLKHPERSCARSKYRFCVFARIRKGQKHEYPWPKDIDPNIKSGHLNYLSHFKPLTEKPKPVTLDFEKPLLDLEKKIIDVRRMADETGLDFSDQINSLEKKYQQEGNICDPWPGFSILKFRTIYNEFPRSRCTKFMVALALKELYTHLTPIQRLSIARHPNRPTFLDHVFNITDKWVELHGDRAGYDDPGIVTGIGSIDGKRYMLMGHQKGRNTKENIQRNFGMPTPHGYRKALRMMKYADHHGFPIITFIDTPGAFADLKSEELGQGEAIAYNLRTMFGLRVPIITVVIGEGGSGGALAIGCANKLFMLENSVFYVASPEACAAILWKSSQAAPKAAEKLKITATELCKLKIADGIIPEPIGGAHTDPAWTSQQIKLAVIRAMEELTKMETKDLLSHRHLKFRKLGGFVETEDVEPVRKLNMKKKEAGIAQTTAEIEVEIENLKKISRDAKIKPSGPTISDEAMEKLTQEVDKEMTDAFISMDLREKLESIKMELSKSSKTSDSVLSPSLKERVDRLAQEFNQGLSRPGSYLGLKQKLGMLTEASRLIEQQKKAERLKKEINEKLQGQLKGKMEILRKAREKVVNGEKLDESMKEEIEQTKEELKEMLKSANLEVVGLSKKLASAPPNLEQKIAQADELIGKEIERAVDMGGLRDKVNKLKEELRSSNKERVKELEKEIREGIVAVMDLEELKRKLENLTADAQVGASTVIDNGRG